MDAICPVWERGETASWFSKLGGDRPVGGRGGGGPGAPCCPPSCGEPAIAWGLGFQGFRPVEDVVKTL
jgi:hypothetical protein